MIRLELLFLMEAFMGVLMLILLLKISQMKKQVDEITKEVRDYLTFIEEDMKQEEISAKGKRRTGTTKEEEESRLIQAVLQEYFP